MIKPKKNPFLIRVGKGLSISEYRFGFEPEIVAKMAKKSLRIYGFKRKFKTLHHETRLERFNTKLVSKMCCYYYR